MEKKETKDIGFTIMMEDYEKALEIAKRIGLKPSSWAKSLLISKINGIEA